MNTIEKKLLGATWVYRHTGYSSVYNKFGWIIPKDQIWLGCVSPETVVKQQLVHATEGDEIAYGTTRPDLRFKIPISTDFLAHVVSPEIFESKGDSNIIHTLRYIDVDDLPDEACSAYGE